MCCGATFAAGPERDLAVALGTAGEGGGCLSWRPGRTTPSPCLSPTGSGHADGQPRTRRTQSRCWARSRDLKRRQDVVETCGNPPKRHRPHSAQVRGSEQLSPVSRAMSRLQALQVGLEELQAPGGAFLRVPAAGTEPTASQRAWLTWQLSHTGNALHWALSALGSVLASQPWPQHLSNFTQPCPPRP